MTPMETQMIDHLDAAPASASGKRAVVFRGASTKIAPFVQQQDFLFGPDDAPLSSMAPVAVLAAVAVAPAPAAALLAACSAADVAMAGVPAREDKAIPVAGLFCEDATPITLLSTTSQAITPASQAPSPAALAPKPDILLVDIAGLGYAAMYTPMGKLAHEGFPTGAIHGAMASLFARMAQRPGAVPVVLWDNKAHWRHEMLPAYKATRGADPAKQAIRDQYRVQIPYLQLLLSLMGIPQVSCGGSEADDLAGAVCRGLDPGWTIEMISRDTDWWQQLDERCSWYSPVHRKSLSLKGLADPDNGMSDGHFLSTNEYLEAKALAGDSSDEIPGIEKVGLLTACKIIRQHGTSIHDFWAQVDSGQVTPKGVVMTRVANAESRAIFERNVKLMDWRQAPALEMGALAVMAGPPDFATLEAEAACLGLKKLVGSAKEALKPWKNGWGSALGAVSAALDQRECMPVMKP